MLFRSAPHEVEMPPAAAEFAVGDHIQAGGYNGYEPEIPGLEMVPVPGLKLEVYGTLNCEYFYKPDIYDVAGTLPVGRYEAVAQSVGCYGGFTWVTLRYKNAVYWTALLADRCFLLRA